MDKTEKNTELSFLEKIVLLALDDKGWFGTAEHKIKFGLVGAILFELVQLKRIEIRDGDLYVIDSKPTDIVVLDRVLNLIGSSKKVRGLRNWIQRIVYKKLMLRKQILKQLLQKKIIRKEEYTLMFVFYQTKFPLVNVELKRTLREEIYNRIVGDSIFLDNDLMLLVVMNNCKMVRKNFGGFIQYLKLRGKINEVTQFHDPQTEPERTIKQLQTAISRAIVASNVSVHV